MRSTARGSWIFEGSNRVPLPLSYLGWRVHTELVGADVLQLKLAAFYEGVCMMTASMNDKGVFVFDDLLYDSIFRGMRGW